MIGKSKATLPDDAKSCINLKSEVKLTHEILDQEIISNKKSSASHFNNLGAT